MIESSEKGARVLICCAEFHGYHYIFKAAFERSGYRCELFDERDCASSTSKALTRLNLRQRFPWAMRAYRAKLVRRVREFRPDVIVVITPEMIDRRAVQALRAAAPGARIILYMWEALLRKPRGIALIDMVDAAFSYDPLDCEVMPRLQFLPLFHTLGDLPSISESGAGHDVVFIGSVQFARLQALATISKTIARQGRRGFFFLYAPTLIHWGIFAIAARTLGFRGRISRKQIPHREYLRLHDEARCVIDIQRGTQSGLALRSLDAIFAGRPLLTTNKLIRRYDFFDKAPVGVFSPTDEVLTFPDTSDDLWPDAELHDRYSLSSWVAILMGRRAPGAYFLPPKPGRIADAELSLA